MLSQLSVCPQGLPLGSGGVSASGSRGCASGSRGCTPPAHTHPLDTHPLPGHAHPPWPHTPPTPPRHSPLDTPSTINKRAVRILLDCFLLILVLYYFEETTSAEVPLKFTSDIFTLLMFLKTHLAGECVRLTEQKCLFLSVGHWSTAFTFSSFKDYTGNSRKRLR